VLVAVLHQPIPKLHQVVMVDFVHEAPPCPFLKLPKGLSVQLQCVVLKRDLALLTSSRKVCDASGGTD
jgi:hypothetical protein